MRRDSCRYMHIYTHMSIYSCLHICILCTYIYIHIHIYMQRDHGAMLSMCVCAHSEHKSENQALTFSVLFDRDSNT